MSISTIKRFTILLCILCSMLSFVSCEKKEDTKATTKVVSAKDEAEIKALGQQFWNTMCEGDLVAMKKIMAKESCDAIDRELGMANLTTDEKAAAVEMAKGVFQDMMKDATVKFGKVTISGKKAEMEISSVIEGESEDESMEFIKEDGTWKIIFEM